MVRYKKLSLLSAIKCKHLEFDKLSRMVQRQQNISEPIPPFYIRNLTHLETTLNDTIKETKKKMNATNAKALTAMKQKVKKAMKEYEVEIKKYQEVCITALSGNSL